MGTQRNGEPQPGVAPFNDLGPWLTNQTKQLIKTTAGQILACTVYCSDKCAAEHQDQHHSMHKLRQVRGSENSRGEQKDNHLFMLLA